MRIFRASVCRTLPMLDFYYYIMIIGLYNLKNLRNRLYHSFVRIKNTISTFKIKNNKKHLL